MALPWLVSQAWRTFELSSERVPSSSCGSPVVERQIVPRRTQDGTLHAGVWNVGEIRMPRRFANDIAEVAQREAPVAQRLALEPENQAWMSGPRL